MINKNLARIFTPRIRGLTALPTPSPPTSPGAVPGRLIKIAVLDVQGRDATAAKVHFLVNGIPAGSFSTGPGVLAGSIEVDDPHAKIELRAEFAGQSLSAVLPQNARQHVFHFPSAAPRTLAAQPAKARCPNGDEGDPCVTCNIGGTRVRICV